MHTYVNSKPHFNRIVAKRNQANTKEYYTFRYDKVEVENYPWSKETVSNTIGGIEGKMG